MNRVNRMLLHIISAISIRTLCLLTYLLIIFLCLGKCLNFVFVFFIKESCFLDCWHKKTPHLLAFFCVRRVFLNVWSGHQTPEQAVTSGHYSAVKMKAKWRLHCRIFQKAPINIRWSVIAKRSEGTNTQSSRWFSNLDFPLVCLSVDPLTTTVVCFFGDF